MLEDGSTVNADYLQYKKSDLFDYAIAVFYEGKLAKVQMETDSTLEEIENALGLKIGDEVIFEKSRIGYELFFDEMFHYINIAVFPFEWDTYESLQ